ncbi:MAG TPA: hypothetical protein DCP98_05350 [Sphaerochaeta sp.]|nr:hypothetical protein [Sphaerochaeta sp.]
MKRNTLTLIAITVLAVIAFCACNIDADEGIYSQVVTEPEDSDITVLNYLGYKKDSDGNSIYYYLSNEGVFKYTVKSGESIESSSNATKKLFSSSKGNIIRSASYYNDNSVEGMLVLTQTADLSTTLTFYTYDSTTDTYDSGTELEGYFSGLLVNGLFYGKQKHLDSDNKAYYKYGIYYFDGSAVNETDIISTNTLEITPIESENYAFFDVTESSEHTFYVINSDSPSTPVINVAGNSNQYVGFHHISYNSSDIYLLLDKTDNGSYAYKLSASGVDDWFTLKSALEHQNIPQSCTFIYDDKIYIKCSSFFDIYDLNEESISATQTNFASELRLTEITNIKAEDETNSPGIFIVGTDESFLYRMDLSSSPSTASSFYY